MLKEAIEKVESLAIAGRTNRLQEIPGAPPGFSLYEGEEGLLPVWAPAQPRQHRALSLQPVIDLAKLFAEVEVERLAGEEGIVREKGRVHVWYSRDAVTAVLDDSDRRVNLVRLPLEYSPQLKKLQEIAVGGAYDQRQLVLLLRTTFGRSLAGAPGLLGAVRSVRFLANTSGTSAVAHGKSSVGKSIERELSGAEALPESFPLHVPVFAPAWARWEQRIDVALNIDEGAERFQLIPMPGDIEAAVAASEDKIGQILTESLKEMPNVGVYYGAP